MTIFFAVLKKHSGSSPSQCEKAVNWVYNNKMVLNPDKFQLILLDKSWSDNTNIKLEIGNEIIRST